MATPKRARTSESTSRNKKTASARMEATAVQTTSQAEIEQAIRIRAYEIWEQRGRIDGNAVEDWLRAEAELGGRASART